MHSDFKKHLLTVTGATDCSETEVIQSLWSGYGKISRYELLGSSRKTVVVKSISLQQVSEHPRGWNTDISHQRKVKSYEVETYWYEHWNQHCSKKCRVPQFLGSFSEGKNQWIILEDLDSHFPARLEQLTLSEVKVCLRWLASFHATFLQQKPTGLWEIGTYWNLQTRPDEWAKIADPKLKAKASAIDERLNKSVFQTIVHGDAKLANFCFSEDGKSVAAVDFQYVGGGCGMKDVAYFLGSCLSSSECELYEEELLNFYFSDLRQTVKSLSPMTDFSALEQEWRLLYPFACADFTRFMLGWMPSHQKVNGYNLKILKKVLTEV